MKDFFIENPELAVIGVILGLVMLGAVGAGVEEFVSDKCVRDRLGEMCPDLKKDCVENLREACR